MNLLRKHWFQLGLGLAALVLAWLIVSWGRSVPLQRILWISLITLFFHQFEEYGFPGGFARMMNTVMFASEMPDRYPLNTNTALIINVLVGWLTYSLAAALATTAIWLGIAAVLVSVGNVVAHAILFNRKGKTRYNPGMLTSLVFFLPLAIVFFSVLLRSGSASVFDWIGGVALGVVLNVVGILKLIDWLRDRNTKYAFW